MPQASDLHADNHHWRTLRNLAILLALQQSRRPALTSGVFYNSVSKKSLMMPAQLAAELYYSLDEWDAVHNRASIVLVLSGARGVGDIRHARTS